MRKLLSVHSYSFCPGSPLFYIPSVHQCRTRTNLEDPTKICNISLCAHTCCREQTTSLSRWTISLSAKTVYYLTRPSVGRRRWWRPLTDKKQARMTTPPREAAQPLYGDGAAHLRGREIYSTADRQCDPGMRSEIVPKWNKPVHPAEVRKLTVCLGAMSRESPKAVLIISLSSNIARLRRNSSISYRAGLGSPPKRYGCNLHLPRTEPLCIFRYLAHARVRSPREF